MEKRLAKSIVVSLTALYMSLVVFNNLLDYSSNFSFVANVTSMSEVFNPHSQNWRAVNQAFLHHFFYCLIILSESIIALLCATGAIQMIKARHHIINYEQAKKYSIYGLLAAVCLWYGGFICVGGEWFLMWQSQNWNGNPQAFRNATFFLLVLIFITQKEE